MLLLKKYIQVKPMKRGNKMKNIKLVISCTVVIILVDIYYLLLLYSMNNYLSLNLVVNYDRTLFRLIYIVNLLLVSYIISLLINSKKKIRSIRPIKIENGYVLLLTYIFLHMLIKKNQSVIYIQNPEKSQFKQIHPQKTKQSQK